jgi:putative IMPACT (imprinted ancient) family translation regulator
MDGKETGLERSSDAGEPSGTAGKPIALAIRSAALSDVLVAVVRWYGGTKLGTGGLARAYRSAAEGALAAAGSRTVADTGIVAVSCPWERMGDLRRLVRPPEVTVVSEKFEEASAIVRLAVFRSRLPALAAALDEARLSYNVEDGRGGGGAESGAPG